MSDLPAKNLPHHFLGVQFRIIGGQEQEGKPWVSFQVFPYRLGMMKSNIVQNQNDWPPRITLANRGQEGLKGFPVSRIRDLPGKDAVFQVNGPEERTALLCPKPCRNDGLLSFQCPHARKGGDG